LPQRDTPSGLPEREQNQVDIGNTLDNKQITDTSIVKSVGWWGIKAEDAVAWSLSLNSNHELDPSSGSGAQHNDACHCG